MKNRKFHHVILAATVMGSTLAAVVPSTPAAAAGCTRAACDDESPTAMGCSSDAITAYQTINGSKVYARSYVSGMMIELRYSASCYAFWTRITNQGSSLGGEMWGSLWGFNRRTKVDFQPADINLPATNGSNKTTKMFGRRDGDGVQYGWCAQIINNSGNTYGQTCWPIHYFG